MKSLKTSSPIKVLHVSAIKGWGGGEKHLENLCWQLQGDERIQNYVFCVKNGEVHQRIQRSSTPYFTAPLDVKVDPRFFLKIGRVCKKHGIDLLHIHDTTALSLAVMADSFFNLPPFVFSKKTSFPIKKRKRTLYKYNYPKLKAILCVSQESARVMSKALTDPSILQVIYHGTRTDTKSTDTPFQIREKFQLGPDSFLIGNIANHIRAKHLETFVEVADILVNQRGLRNFFFVQIGNFTDRTKELQRKIDRLGLQDHVKLLNKIPDASNFIPQFNVSMVTSQSEGIPQVIYESFLHGIPVVSTRVGGIPEIIENGINGHLSEALDAQGLAGHIVSLQQDEESGRRFSSLSKQKLLENYTSEKMATQTLKAYESILKKGNSAT